MTIDTLAIAARRRHFHFVYVYMRSPIDNASTVSSCRELCELINLVTRIFDCTFARSCITDNNFNFQLKFLYYLGTKTYLRIIVSH